MVESNFFFGLTGRQERESDPAFVLLSIVVNIRAEEVEEDTRVSRRSNSISVDAALAYSWAPSNLHFFFLLRFRRGRSLDGGGGGEGVKKEGGTRHPKGPGPS